MTSYKEHLDWLDTQVDAMCDLVIEWSNINSHTYNLDGLEQVAAAITPHFAALDCEVIEHALPPHCIVNQRGETEEIPLGHMLLFRKRKESPLRVLLGIHMDTVFPADHPFQRAQRRDDKTLTGPGVSDAKGGIAVMLKALEALERSPVAEHIGWDVFINPDEEIGSPGSVPLLEELAKEHALGLVFEPSLPNGAIVSERKGTAHYTLVIHGRESHAGRAPRRGRHAINKLVTAIARVNALEYASDGILINVGHVEGGGPVNVVPDLAIARIGARATTPQDQELIEATLASLARELNAQEGFSADLHGGFRKPPKIMDAATEALLYGLRESAEMLGQPLRWEPTGGACDGNTLAAAGLPTVDSLGPRGGALHSADEFAEVKSLPERAKLVALLLMRLAAGEWTLTRS